MTGESYKSYSAEDNQDKVCLLAVSLSVLGLECEKRWYDFVRAKYNTRETQGAFLKLAFKERVLPYVVHALLKEGIDFGGILINIEIVLRTINETQMRLASEINEIFLQNDVPVRWIKGVEVALSSYPLNVYRIMFDLDVLVPPPALFKAKLVLEEAGFAQGEPIAETLIIKPISASDISMIETSHYETAPYFLFHECPDLILHSEILDTYISKNLVNIVGERAYITMSIDVHFNLAPDIELCDIWKTPSKLSNHGYGMLDCHDLTTSLWFHASRGYQETFQANQPRIRQFLDVLAIIGSHENQIDWPELERICVKYNLYPSIFYPLTHAANLLPEKISMDLLKRINPLVNTNRRQGDFGDWLPRLLNYLVTRSISDTILLASTQTKHQS